MKTIFNSIAKLTAQHTLQRELTKAGFQTPNLDKVEKAIAQGADVNKPNGEGKTPLVICAEKFSFLMSEEESIPLTRAIMNLDLIEGQYKAQAEPFLKAAEKLIAAGADTTAAQIVLEKASAQVQDFANILKKSAKPAAAAPQKTI